MPSAARLNFVVAGDSREFVEKTVGVATWRRLAERGFADRAAVGCVGFLRDVDSNSLLVVLPKAFSSVEARRRLVDRSYQRDQLFRLVRVFRKIRIERKYALSAGGTNAFANKDLETTDPVLDSFDAAVKLRRDYLDSGLYARKTTARVLNTPSLPVDWGATVRNTIATIQDEQLLFSHTIHRSRRHDASNSLRLLQATCLKEIFELTGERFNFEGVSTLPEKVFSKVKSRPNSVLRQLREAVFDERGRFLIHTIKSYLGESRLRELEHKQQEDLLAFSRDFENIWEHVLRDLISPDSRNRALAPGRWRSWPSAQQSIGIRPEFDIRLSVEDTDVIIDAKDYRILNGSRWLGSSSDHYKQIIYRKLSEVSSGAKDLNILAFPGVGQRSLFQIRGCHEWLEINNSRIFEVTVDYDLAMKVWLKEMSISVPNEFASLLNDIRDFEKLLSEI
jgi:hypothetical protein